MTRLSPSTKPSHEHGSTVFTVSLINPLDLMLDDTIQALLRKQSAA
ncbi:hypothetical protein [Lentibacter sp.]